MAVKLIMPKLGLNMVEGQIAQWLKKEGDTVTKGETIYVVETDKVTNEVEAPEDGVLVKIIVDEGDIVPVRKIVGVLAKPGEEVNLGKIMEGEKGDASVKEAVGKSTGIPIPSSTPSSASAQVIASPLVKRMAAEKGIDLGTIVGSGPSGRIMAEDLNKAELDGSDRDGAIEIPGKVIPLTNIRKLVAERMSQASRTMAMITLNSDLDVTPIVAYRNKMKIMGKEKDEIPGINSILISLTAKTLSKFPYLNASFEEDGIRLYEPVNIGLAVDTVDGLMVVVVKNADKKSMDEVKKDLAGLVERAQNHKSNPEDLQGGTFTITNLGMYGVDSFNPIINPPETGILGVGRFNEKQFSNQKDNMSRYGATFSLTFDHRVIDGAPAAQFLQRLQEVIFSLK